MGEVIAYYKSVNLDYLRSLIIVIHKCVDGKCSNNIYYNKRRELSKESLQQTEEIVNIDTLLNLNSGYINSELKIITDLFEYLILNNTDDFSCDMNKETSIRILLRMSGDVAANYYNLKYDFKRELFRYNHISFIKKQ